MSEPRRVYGAVWLLISAAPVARRIPPEPPVGSWVKDRHGAVMVRCDRHGWAPDTSGWVPLAQWKGMWDARGPLIPCGPYGAELKLGPYCEEIGTPHQPPGEQMTDIKLTYTGPAERTSQGWRIAGVGIIPDHDARFFVEEEIVFRNGDVLSWEKPSDMRFRIGGVWYDSKQRLNVPDSGYRDYIKMGKMTFVVRGPKS